MSSHLGFSLRPATGLLSLWGLCPQAHRSLQLSSLRAVGVCFCPPGRASLSCDMFVLRVSAELG